jgi:hypothetical protein
MGVLCSTGDRGVGVELPTHRLGTLALSTWFRTQYSPLSAKLVLRESIIYKKSAEQDFEKETWEEERSRTEYGSPQEHRHKLMVSHHFCAS